MIITIVGLMWGGEAQTEWSSHKSICERPGWQSESQLLGDAVLCVLMYVIASGPKDPPTGLWVP